MAPTEEFNKELLVLNSVCKTKDIQPVLATNVAGLFVAFPEVWDFLKDYYYTHKAIPDVELLVDKFSSFDAVATPGQTSYYVEELRQNVIESELKNIAAKLHTKTGKIPYDTILDGVLGDLMKLKNVAVESQTLDVTDFASAAERYRETRLLAEQMGGVPGIPCGVDFIDSAYPTGLAGGDLIVLLGWTGRAKSLLSTYICCNAFTKGFKPMIVSLEMNTAKVQDRIYTMLAKGRFKNSDLSIGDVNEDEFREWSKTINKGKGFVVESHDGNHEVTPAWVQSKIDQHKPDLIVLDYAQLMSDNANTGDMTARMRNMSKEFKRLAQANKIPIIIISSATPDSTSSVNSAPIVEQVAWSKQLAFDADLAMAIHRHDGVIEEGWVVIEVAGRKNRNGDLFSGYFKANINEGLYEEFWSLEEIGTSS